MPSWRNDSPVNTCTCGEAEYRSVEWRYNFTQFDHDQNPGGLFSITQNACFKCNAWLNQDCRNCNCGEQVDCGYLCRPDYPFTSWQKPGNVKIQIDMMGVERL